MIWLLALLVRLMLDWNLFMFLFFEYGNKMLQNDADLSDSDDGPSDNK